MQNSNAISHDTLAPARAQAALFQARWLDASVDDLRSELAALTTPEYAWRGSSPLYEHASIDALCDEVLVPLKRALNPLKRCEYIALSGINDADGGRNVWTCSLGVLAGAFVGEWLGLQPTHKLVQLRYAEFQEVREGLIAQTALLIDLADFLAQIGLDPFPRQLGARGIFPPPVKQAHADTDPQAAKKTMALLNRMIADLDLLNRTGEDTCPPEYLARCWHEDVAWYGPAGIGAMMSIPLYQRQHQFPFRQGLKNKQYHGHVARIADGEHAAFFGWPNLTNSPRGGYLELPESNLRGEMRIVDVYRRDGDRLSENWVIIDLPHYFSFFGIDLLGDAIARQVAG